MKKKMIIIIGISLLIDQLIKFIIDTNYGIYQSTVIIKDFFNITYVRNYGAAFSILNGNRIFFIIFGLLSTILIYKFLIKDQKLDKLSMICYSTLISGILGNLIDRIIRGYVVDYLDFKIINYYFPVFNFADICIVVSTILIFIISFKGEKNETN